MRFLFGKCPPPLGMWGDPRPNPHEKKFKFGCDVAYLAITFLPLLAGSLDVPRYVLSCSTMLLWSTIVEVIFFNLSIYSSSFMLISPPAAAAAVAAVLAALTLRRRA